MKTRSLLNKFSSKGFTLIELLIVIAILGVLAAGILVAIDPIDKINQSNDAKVQNDVSGMARAAEAYAILHNGLYPVVLDDLVNSGELKRAPVAPSGYDAYVFLGQPDNTSVLISGQLKSKKYTSVDTPFWNYNSSTGKSCARRLYWLACP
ncbi:MAG: prepilin-type N-terminal cleavage/methylation domain-containing protein [Candidatus Levybacteria bacterium]|nr:prepilin-type N-terminal cleavage/methylation domain-containing protein [Candidatus Levybacteria bacterium]